MSFDSTYPKTVGRFRVDCLHAEIRQMVHNREIGGECDNRVLAGALIRMGMTEVEAAVAIDEAWAAGYIEPGFWAKTNWAPVSAAGVTT